MLKNYQGIRLMTLHRSFSVYTFPCICVSQNSLRPILFVPCSQVGKSFQFANYLLLHLNLDIIISNFYFPGRKTYGNACMHVHTTYTHTHACTYIHAHRNTLLFLYCESTVSSSLSPPTRFVPQWVLTLKQARSDRVMTSVFDLHYTK